MSTTSPDRKLKQAAKPHWLHAIFSVQVFCANRQKNTSSSSQQQKQRNRQAKNVWADDRKIHSWDFCTHTPNTSSTTTSSSNTSLKIFYLFVVCWLAVFSLFFITTLFFWFWLVFSLSFHSFSRKERLYFCVGLSHDDDNARASIVKTKRTIRILTEQRKRNGIRNTG